VLFLVMVCVAAVNRQRLTPRLSAAGPGRDPMRQLAMRRLARNGVIELVLGLAIFALVGVLGTLPPGLHEQPVWPFPVRLSAQALNDPDVLRRAFVALAAWVAGAVVVTLGIWWRRLRWPLVVGGAALFLFFAPAFGAFFEEAYPTSFYASPTRYAATSITQGRRIFDERCASCHGADGRGAGVKAAASIEQLDLVGNHVYAHPDGDLFWWITNGVGAAMPGFGTALDEDARWDLIDFIHANADAARLQALAGKVIARGYSTPNFSAECGDGASMTVDELRGKMVHVVAAAGTEPQALIRLRARDRAHDVRTILIEPSSATPPDGDAESCVASDPSVSETMAIYRGVPVASIAGTELLIDEAGLLRSLWFPGARPNWADDDRFMRVLDSLRKTPAAPMAMGGHAHH
jgi:mono/diheme cytochrome c family protein